MNTHCISILNKLTYVSHVEPASNIVSTVETRRDAPWGLQRISSLAAVSEVEDALAYTYTYASSDLGRGADIYILDTGIYTDHFVFGGRAQMGWSYDGNMTDLDGHGTHVAGVAAGAQVGVASNANLIGVKALSGNGSGSSSDIIAGIDYTIKRHAAQRTQPSFVGSALSLSISSGGIISTLNAALLAATNAGIHVIAAAGNVASDACLFSPSDTGGNSGAALVVGSISSDAAISSFSNTGPCVDVYAPGENVISAWPPVAGNKDNDTVKALSGTSMATPYVTGLVAYAMVNSTLAGSVELMKEWVRMTALSGIVVQRQGVVDGDESLLASNGVVQALREQVGFIGWD
ncbi:hypothetical protein MBLNU459_g3042t1 [Dothideomycetes sp. NU459]